jgi:hypothetical protein
VRDRAYGSRRTAAGYGDKRETTNTANTPAVTVASRPKAT